MYKNVNGKLIEMTEAEIAEEKQKIQLAKTQLRSTTKSISQISAELGYVNTSHFINLFKRYEGITPSVYRQHRYK